MKKRISAKRIILIALLAALAALLIWGIFFRKKESSTQGAADEVNIEEIRRRTIVSSVSGNGTVVAGATETVRVEITGTKLSVLNVREGDRVSAGEVIAYLDTTDLEERRRDLQESYNDAVKNRSEQNQTYDERLEDSQTSRAERIEETKRQLEEADADIEKYETELAEAQAKADDLQKQVDEKQARLDEAREPVDEAETLVNNTQAQLDAVNARIRELQDKAAAGANAADPGAAENGESGEEADGSTGAGENGVSSGLTAAEEAELESLQDQKSQLESTLAEARAQYAQAYSEYLQTEQQINITPLQQNLIQQQSVVNQKDTSLRTARSRKDSLNDQLTSLQEQNDDSITDARKSYNDSVSDQLDSIREQIDSVQEQIDSCTVRAGISGVVTSLPVAEGERYNGGTLAVIENTDQFFVEAQIDEYDIPDIEEGMDARIKTDATRDDILTGTVIFVAPSADTGNSSSLSDISSLAGLDMSDYTGSSGSDATFLVRISLDEQNERLRLGMTANVSIIVESAEDVWTVPYEAVYERGDGTYYIEIVDADAPVDENGNRIFSKKELDVEVGLEGTYYTEIRADGLSEGMEVVVPKAGGTDTLNELMNMMGSDGGI